MLFRSYMQEIRNHNFISGSKYVIERFHLNENAEDIAAEWHEMAQELRELNEERKNMTDTEAKKAIEMVEGTDLYEDNVLVVYLPECHESVAGIIAGRLREHFYKPSIVITDAADGAKGSGRSIEGYNMFEEITKCKELLTKFGGHPMAAGLSLPTENIDLFRAKLNRQQTLTEKELTPVTWIDVPMPVSYEIGRAHV